MKPRVVDSLQNREADHCVDIFVRDDGTFGFEEYRRDHEDGRGWFPVAHYAVLTFATQDAALAEARSRVRWLAPEPSFQVRRANAFDADALETLYRDCRRDAQWLPATRCESTFALVSQGEAVYVAVTDAGDLEGFVSVWESEPFVHHLYVREESRGRGVGGALLASLVGKLPFPWRLKCVRANTQALDFYTRRGWQPKGEGVGSEGAYVELLLDGSPSSSRINADSRA